MTIAFKMTPYGTHQPLLAAALAHTSGPIVELGAGWYSTPLVSAFAHSRARPALTVETGQFVFDALHYLVSPPHVMELWPGFTFDRVGRFARDPAISHDCYRAMQAEHLATLDARGFGRPSVVLVDHAPGILRAPAIAFFADRAEFIVVHDAHPYAIAYYGLQLLEGFRYRWTMTSLHPQTAVVSNVRDCSVFSFLDGAQHEGCRREPAERLKRSA